MEFHHDYDDDKDNMIIMDYLSFLPDPLWRRFISRTPSESASLHRRGM